MDSELHRYAGSPKVQQFSFQIEQEIQSGCLSQVNILDWEIQQIENSDFKFKCTAVT